MSPKAGDQIWIPCEVKPGPFSNERLVRVTVPDAEEWVGFAPAHMLQDDLLEGATNILGTIVEVHDDSVSVYFPGGHSLAQSWFKGAISRIRPLGSVESRHSSVSR
ncbi:MAG TPA: hypothetical protein VF432_06905 [Thermoanaerobaculia bacterium]